MPTECATVIGFSSLLDNSDLLSANDKLINNKEEYAKTVGEINNNLINNKEEYAKTLEEIKERFPEGMRVLVEKETKELMEVLGQLKDVNSENAQLLQQALRIVNVTINTITGADESNEYPKDKKKDGSQSKGRNLVDRKI